MEGIIKSYVPEKKYGFIIGNDGKSYFFHRSYFNKEKHPLNISEGMLVSFDPTPGPRGLRAKRLSIERKHSVYWVHSRRFITTKYTSLKNSKVFFQTPLIESSSETSPDEAKRDLVSLAANLGANALLSLRYHKSTGHSDNYQYTVHHYTGYAAVVMEKKLSTDLEKVKDSEEEGARLAERLNTSYEEYAQKLAKEKSKVDRATTILDIVMAGMLSLVPVIVTDSWLVGAVVFCISVLWILRPRAAG